MKFVLFLILVLPIGCAVTSTKQLEQTSQGGKDPTASQLSNQSESEEAKASSGLEVQRILNGRMEYPRPENIKLAEPVPETLLRRSPGFGDKVDTSSSPKRQPWGGIWLAPLNRSAPSVGDESSSKNVETPPPASWKDYKEVPFGKFASGSYSSDYANKYVKVKCRFSSIATELAEIPKYQQPAYITFFVTGIDSQLHSLRIVVPKSQADVLFKLEPQEEIVLYGKAVQVDLHTLTMEVRRIER